MYRKGFLQKLHIIPEEDLSSISGSIVSDNAIDTNFSRYSSSIGFIGFIGFIGVKIKTIQFSLLVLYHIYLFSYRMLAQCVHQVFPTSREKLV